MNKKILKSDFDVVVVGAGPNGLSAAITMKQAGLSVLLIEGKNEIGGGSRSSELTLPGYLHDVCSAIHPMALASPYFKTIALEKYGLQFIQPDLSIAHPFDDGSAAVLYKSVEQTARSLGEDEAAYMQLMKPMVDQWEGIDTNVLGPLRFPAHPLDMLRFGWFGLRSAQQIAKRFKTREAKALWAGMAAHTMLPLSGMATSAAAMVLMSTGHIYGWPVAKGGSSSITNALLAYFISIGGELKTNFEVQSTDELPVSKAILLDVTPKQLLKIAGKKLSPFYKWQLERFKYGPGVFKIDWALSEQIPFLSGLCRKAGTVHLGNTMEEISLSEELVAKQKHADQPFVLLAQQSLFDATRAPQGKHTGWAYCHVPNNSPVDMTLAIEKQVERFAPGFMDLILARHVMRANEFESYNPNYIGGDINGGMMNITQLFTRPVIRLSPYKTSAKGIYICSSSTPPGGGVHGMCGFYAAKRALKDVFNIARKL